MLAAEVRSLGNDHFSQYPFRAQEFLNGLSPELTLRMWANDYSDNRQAEPFAICGFTCEQVKVRNRSAAANKYLGLPYWSKFTARPAFANQFLIGWDRNYADFPLFVKPPVLE